MTNRQIRVALIVSILIVVLALFACICIELPSNFYNPRSWREFSTLFVFEGNLSYKSSYIDILQKEDGQWYMVVTEMRSVGREETAYVRKESAYAFKNPSLLTTDDRIYQEGAFVSEKYAIISHHNTTPPMGIPYLYGHQGDMLLAIDKKTQTAMCVYRSSPRRRILYGDDKRVVEYDASTNTYRYLDCNSGEVIHTRTTNLHTWGESYSVQYEADKQEIQILDASYEVIERLPVFKI